MKFMVYVNGLRPGSGGWCYVETIREMGHRVSVFQSRAGLEMYENNKAAKVWLKIARKPFRIHRKKHIKYFLEAVNIEHPDAIVIFDGMNLGSEEIMRLRETGAWVVNINHDDFFSRNRNNWSPLMHEAIPKYDFIFTTREVNEEEIKPLNPCVEWMPFAYYPRIHRPVPIPDHEKSQWDVDVVFIGSWENDRCRLLEYLVRELPGRYAIWGHQWEKVRASSPIFPFIKKRAVLMDDMAKAIRGAKVALGFLRKANRDDHTQRTFEIPACGGVLLGERTMRHLQYFREGEEAEFFDPRSPRELTSKVALLLKGEARRERIRVAGRDTLLNQRHTYRDRIERLLEVYRSVRQNPHRVDICHADSSCNAVL